MQIKNLYLLKNPAFFFNRVLESIFIACKTQ